MTSSKLKFSIDLLFFFGALGYIALITALLSLVGALSILFGPPRLRAWLNRMLGRQIF